MPVLLKVRGIRAFQHKLGKFILTTFYISCLDWEDFDIYACIKCKLHLIENLKANISIGNNILCIKGFFIDFTNVIAQIANYRVNIMINAGHYFKFLKLRLLANPAIFILPKSVTLILFQ